MVRMYVPSVVLLATASLFAQTTSSIEGLVKDPQGATVQGAALHITSSSGFDQKTTSDARGAYRLVAVPAGVYRLDVTKEGFAVAVYEDLNVTLNQALTFDVGLQLGTVQDKVTVQGAVAQLEASTSSVNSLITPEQITQLPVNGRNYLDLLQLVPGVTVNHQADQGSDQATPSLGERGGNSNFLIDGLPNKDTVSGGPAVQFTQETIAEFQVITTGYKAEFGMATGAIVNVITKSGGNDFHGIASLFHRNNGLDTSDLPGTSAPFLHRWDYGLGLGGPIVKDKVFFYGSSERITEGRRLNFTFPAATPAVIRSFETQFDKPQETHETRNFFKLDEKFGRHSLFQQMNYTNSHVSDFLPLSAATNLPSTRQDMNSRHLLFGAADTWLVGDQANPLIVTIRGAYRGEPFAYAPAHPDAGPSTRFNIFDSYTSGSLFGNLGAVVYGNGVTPYNLNQRYGNFSVSADKLLGNHELKFGTDYLYTNVDGSELSIESSQLFATVSDFLTYGPVNSGYFLLATAGAPTAAANQIRLRNHHPGLFIQDDWKITKKLTINAGLRWEYDSQFANKTNFQPRIGAAYALDSKTVVRGSFGIFYDQFRLGLARDVPGFGGADLRVVQPQSYPRLFYGVPTLAPLALNSICLTSAFTDQQITGSPCPYAAGLPYYGADHLNNIVASGHAPIPANSVVNQQNVQQLSGLTPDQYLAQAASAIGKPNGFWYWGTFGLLSTAGTPQQPIPVQVAPGFATPNTYSLNVGIQRELWKDFIGAVDYYHRDLHNILGVREVNLLFVSRLANSRQFSAPVTTGPAYDFGPWYSGTYDGFTVSLNKRFSQHFQFGAFYSYSNANDDALCPSLYSAQSQICLPSDSFNGVVPLVTDSKTGQTNANGPFISSVGNPVPKAGVNYNGATLDTGRSDLALKHTFQVNGLVTLPSKFEISGIFRVQSGFPYSRLALQPKDVDGNGNFTGYDIVGGPGRNVYTSPHYSNMDVRFSKRFVFKERIRVQALFEIFNLFNSANTAAVQQNQNQLVPFGTPLQILPGREGQAGLRLEF